MKQYYSIYLEYQGVYEELDSLGNFRNIQEVDSHTIFYTHEDFVKEVSFIYSISSMKYTNFFISSLRNKTKFYPCIFFDIKSYQTKKVLELLKDYLNANTAKHHHNLVHYLFYNITADYRKMMELISSSMIDWKLKEYFRNCLDFKSSMYYYPKIKKKLDSYLVLRTLIVEYMNIFQSQKTFSSLKKNDWNLEEIHYLNEAYHSFFSNDVVAELFQNGGTSLVLKELDGNLIYSLPHKDLLKLGLISEEQYLTLKKGLN